MNYYAQGGQAHGLKSLTGHKIQTKDGVPSFGIGGFFQRNIMQPATNAVVGGVKAVQNVPGIKQVSDVSTQAFKPIDQALVGFDKAVGRAIPGGWGTIAQTVAAMTPGMQPLAIGLGAANGSGIMRKGGSFDLKGAMVGGATAYATSELGEYLRAAGGAPDAAMLPVSEGGNAVAANGVNAATGEIGSGLAGNASSVIPDTSSFAPSAGDFAGSASDTTAGMAQAYTPPPPQGILSNLTSGNFSTAGDQFLTKAGDAFTNARDYLYDAGKSVVQAPGKAVDAIGNYDYSGALGRVGTGMSDVGSGIKNLTGFGEGTVKEAIAAGATSGVKPMPMLGVAGYGMMTLADQEAQLDFLKQQKAAGNIAQDQYDKEVAEIARQRDYAADVVSKSPFNTNPSRDTSIGDTYYGRGNEIDNLYSRLSGENRLYAMGGTVESPDDQTGMANGTPLRNFEQGGIMGYAAGGQPRFLSGGGDGMSDSIPATIGGSQEARLADGEFVVPADVVSHLGNGSSKAGAKQLYSMMDKVRTARTGRKSQGKQINPRKYLAA